MKQRSEQERVAELEAKIAAIKARGERKKARGNPSVKFSVAAAKLLAKALGETQDPVARRVLDEARTSIAGWCESQGWAVPVAATKPEPGPKKRRKNNTAMATAN